ncbi:MAG: hypothetical protein E3J78_06220 [Candidatus Cloacimonadota bacterium]|nr:MAG: hypothetical protein E3J78_06220 [Candidatus Cloacimonadota bacterium]
MFANLDYDTLKQELSNITAILDTYAKQRETMLNSLESFEAHIKGQQTKLKKINEGITESRNDESGAQLKRSEINERIIVIEERKKYLVSQIDYLKNENQMLDEKIPALQTCIDSTKKEMHTTDEIIGEKEVMQSEFRNKLSKLEEEYVIKREHYDNTLAKKEQIEQNIKLLFEQQISRTADLRNGEDNKNSMFTDLEELGKDSEAVEGHITKLINAISEKKQHEEQLRALLSAEREKHNALEGSKKSLDLKLNQLRERMGILNNEIELLKNFMAKKEGYNELVQYLHEKFALPILPEVIDIDDERKEALLGMLENFAQTVILTDASSFENILDSIEKKQMRVGILLAYLDKSAQKTPREKVIHGSVAQFLSIKDKSIDLARIQAIFSRYLLVDTIEDALQMHNKYPDFIFVTQKGDVVSNGILSTGKGTRRELIGIKEKIASNNKEIECITEEIRKREGELTESEKERTKISKKLEKLNTEFSDGIVSMKDDEIAYEKRLFERTTNKKRFEKMQSELSAMEKTFAGLQDTIVSAERLFREENERLEIAEKKQLAKEEEFKEAEERLRILHNSENENVIALTRLKGEARAKEEELKSGEKELDTLQNKKQENLKRLQTFNEEMVRGEEERKVFEEKREKSLELLLHIHSDLQELTGQKTQISNERETLEEKQQEITDNEKDLYGKISNLNLERVRIETRMRSVVERIKEEYNIDLQSLQETTIASSREKVREDLEILEEQMRTFGAINLLAEEDMERIEGRRDELVTHKTDLQEAQKDLLKTIKYVDMVAREKFLETFNAIRENFKIVFSKLFESGECDLTLSGDDPLEANILITATPKHKKITRIDSLSTGEKTLIAIALLFSFYLIKPSPICVLDEIDAPLDDANIKRFIALLQEFKKKSQLIVITHNKITMEAADHLYGITMSEPNVSTVASVKIS